MNMLAEAIPKRKILNHPAFVVSLFCAYILLPSGPNHSHCMTNFHNLLGKIYSVNTKPKYSETLHYWGY